MNGGHWTELDFINHAYGVGPGDGHLDVCADCRERWAELQVVRREIIREPEVSHQILAEQRRNIYHRLERKPGPGARIAPAFAAVLLLLIGIFFIRQSEQVPAAPPTSVSDAQLFSEIYALEQTSEPHVAKPMRSLFEEN